MVSLTVHRMIMNMPSVSFVSVILVLPLVLAALSIGMLYTERIHGTGTYIPMDFMPMHSLHSAIRYGGIGDIIPTVPDGVGDGHVLTMDGVVTIPVTGVAGMAVGTVAAIGAVIGDTIMAIIPDGVAVITGPITVIRIDVHLEVETGILRELPGVPIQEGSLTVPV